MSNNLDIYHQYGFKFLLCKADKSPDIEGFLIENDPRCWNEKDQLYKKNYDWKQPENQISLEKAIEYQSIGRMIGAWIPEGIVVIDLDRHEGKPNGVKTMESVKAEYNINYSITDTFVVTTSGNGIHIFYTTDKIFRQNEKAPGIDLKTNKGYIIAAGSPGYSIFSESEPQELPFELEQWLYDCDTSNIKDNHKKALEKKNNQENDNTQVSGQKITPETLDKILKKTNPADFDTNDTWLEFIMSCIFMAGNTSEVHEILENWSKQDPKYSDDKSIIKRIESFEEIKNITAGTFVYYLKKQNVSQYIINLAITEDLKLSEILVNGESSEIELPFGEIDYNKISETSSSKEFLKTQGNTSAASILEMALNDKVIYDSGQKESYYFNGSRWIYFTNIYEIMYTVLFRVIKILYNKDMEDESEKKLLSKCVNVINNTNWKQMTWKEFCSKQCIYRKSVPWDSPKIKETITLIDGVIDFSNNKVEKRNGYHDEYRKSYFNYTVDEIGNAKTPKIFIKFLEDLFPDKETLEMAKYCISMSISGNASKKYFHLWPGIQDNGKTTLVETLKHVLGRDKAYKFPSELLLKSGQGKTNRETYRSELVQFQGKYFCFATEIEKGSRLSQNVVKEMTGGDTISGRAMNKDSIEFEATWQIVYCVNDLPAFDGSDGALIDRILILPFKTFFWKDEDKLKEAKKRGVKEKFIKKANKSTEFKNSLYSEKAEIIRWMIENYNYLNTKLDGAIKESPESLLYKQKYVQDNNDIGLFLDTFCIIDYTENENWFIKADDLLDEYHNFMGSDKRQRKSFVADIRKENVLIENVQKWFNDIDSSGISIKKRHVVLTNIRLRTPEEKTELANKEEKENEFENIENKIKEELEKQGNLKDLEIEEIPFQGE